jgi:hypothetical protein
MTFTVDLHHDVIPDFYSEASNEWVGRPFG